MSFLFKVKFPFEQFKVEAQKSKVPLKLYTVTLDQVTAYILIPIGSSGLMDMYYYEEYGDQEKLDNIVSELERMGFKPVESLELPLP